MGFERVNLVGQNRHFLDSQREPGERKNKRIAIVDDERDLCSLLSMLIKSLGYHVEFVAYDGNEVVQAVMDGTIQPDLIIMDERMPLMNGMQAAEMILSKRPEIKIMIATADDSVEKDATSAGLLFIQKPFSISALTQTIRDALGEPKSSGDG